MIDIEKRIRTGIFGLDQIMSGGFREKSAVAVVGASGTGKSTFVMQFLMHGINNGEQGLYVTMGETPEQILQESELMGFNMAEHYEKDLFFIHLKGRNFKEMVNDELPRLVKSRADFKVKTRVAVDTMTPLIWAVKNKEDRREIISKLFNTFKKLGVLMVTVEEHSKPGKIIGEEVLLPIYLADTVIHLNYLPIGNIFDHTLQILKMRGCHHGEGTYKFIIARGVGVIIQIEDKDIRLPSLKKFDKLFDDTINKAKGLKAPDFFIKKLKCMKASWTYDYSPEKSLDIIIRTIGLEQYFNDY